MTEIETVRASFAAYLDQDRETAERLLADDDDDVLYEYELAGGGRYRNAEAHTVRDGQIHEARVFFGGRLDTA